MKENVYPSKGKKCKRINLVANVIFSLTFVGYIGNNVYQENHNDMLYDSLNMTFKAEKTVEYGSDDYDTLNFVENVENGEIIDYSKELDTNSIGAQKLSYQIGVEDITKDYLINVNVVDTKKPIIELAKDNTTLYKGSSFDLNSNVVKVSDEVDGNLEYVQTIPEKNEKGYYIISSDFDSNKLKTYTVTIKAVDKNGNESTKSYTINVVAKPVKKVVQKSTVKNNTSNTTSSYTGPSSVDTSSVRNAALSLIGSRYKYASANPSVGFDCSGFVYYVYSLFGKTLARTASGMMSVGHGVSEENMQAGDIIVWTDNGRSATHVSIYIGGGEMVHAANRRLGVVRHTVSHWKSGGRNRILSIRRV